MVEPEGAAGPSGVSVGSRGGTGDRDRASTDRESEDSDRDHRRRRRESLLEIGDLRRELDKLRAGKGARRLSAEIGRAGLSSTAISRDRVRRSRQRTRSRSARRSRSRERTLDSMKQEMERLQKKVNIMETGKKWKNTRLEKQFQFITEVKQVMVEDLRVML